MSKGRETNLPGRMPTTTVGGKVINQLGGFSGGINRKRELLRIEGIEWKG